MRIRMQVAAVEVISDDTALVKLYPVKEQPEDGVFPDDIVPQGSFAVQVSRARLPELQVGKEFDLLFALPIHQIPSGLTLEEEHRITNAKPGEAVEITRDSLKHPEVVKAAVEDDVSGLTAPEAYDLGRADERSSATANHQRHIDVQVAAQESRRNSIHGVACNLRTGEGTECNCGWHDSYKTTPAPDYDLSPDERVI